PAPGGLRVGRGTMTDLTARYAKAEALLPHNMRKLITSTAGVPNWIGDSDTFWYRRQTTTGHEFVVVDAQAGTQELAFDHDRLAKSLSVALETDVSADALPLTSIEPRAGSMRVGFGPLVIDVALEDFSATVVVLNKPEEA